MLKEDDRVNTLVEKEGFPAGTIGVVVSIIWILSYRNVL